MGQGFVLLHCIFPYIASWDAVHMQLPLLVVRDSHICLSLNIRAQVDGNHRAALHMEAADGFKGTSITQCYLDIELMMDWL